MQDVPEAIISYISKAVDAVEIPDISGYASSSKKRHRKIILQHLNISDDDHKQRDIMKQSALKSAIYKEGLADIINDMIETLVKERFEIPGFSTLERMARAARAITSTKLYKKITTELNDEAKVFLDSLFDANVAPESATTCWAFLKQEIKAPTTQNVKEYSDYLSKLREWRSKVPAIIDDIPAHRLEQFIAEATALDSSDMKNLKQDKRYALAITMLHFKLAKGLDDIASILIRWLRKMRHKAKQKLDDYTLTKKSETDRLVEVLHGILLASSQPRTPAERLEALEKSLPSNKEETIFQCEQYLAHARDNYLPFMFKLYQNKRYVLFQLLEQIQLRSASQDKSLEKAAAFIIKHRQNKQKTINIVASDFDQLSWLSDKWFNLVTDNKRPDEIMQVNKKYFEMG